jgi:hypothetical protein
MALTIERDYASLSLCLKKILLHFPRNLHLFGIQELFVQFFPNSANLEVKFANRFIAREHTSLLSNRLCIAERL